MADTPGYLLFWILMGLYGDRALYSMDFWSAQQLLGPLGQVSESCSVGEPHPHALIDPYMSLSAHTAPINQPQLHGLALPNGSSHFWLTIK